MDITTVVLGAPDEEIQDVQLWSKGPAPKDLRDVSWISYVNYQMVPVYLIGSENMMVYSNDDKTNGFFGKLFGYSNDVGMLFKSRDEEYLVFYPDARMMKIRCFIINFNQLYSILDDKQDEDTSISNNDEIFDKILLDKQKKLQSKSQGSTPPIIHPDISGFTNNDQILQAINKVILSGLRLRGLSTKSSTISKTERINIKEIIKMTQDSTLFALRKYKYSFHEKDLLHHPIKLNDIQLIVENLLQVYIDIEE